MAVDLFEPIEAARMCPRCGSVTERCWTQKPANVISDEIPGGMWQENGFHTPQKFYSKKERDRALAEKGLEIRVEHRGENGTDKSKHTTNWASGLPEAYLAGVKAMLERCAKESTASTPTTPEFQWPVSWGIRVRE